MTVDNEVQLPRQSQDKYSIDKFVSLLQNTYMARFADVVDGLGKQALADVEEIRRTGKEMEDLRTAYQRYRDLSSHIEARSERVKTALALLAKQEKWGVWDAFKVLETAGVEIKDPVDLRTELPLWKMVREVVRQAEELRIVELENIMSALKVKTSRQAVEAAIDAHKRTFHVRRSGREKFVSLR